MLVYVRNDGLFEKHLKELSKHGESIELKKLPCILGITNEGG